MTDHRDVAPAGDTPAAALPAPPRRRGGDVAAIAALVAGAIVVWRTRVCVDDAPYGFVSGDAFGYFLPAYGYEAERIAAGSFPLWNPYQGGGVPFVATLQPGALHPARLLALVAAPADAMGWSALAHVLVALLGTYALCRRLGARPAPAATAAIVFTTAFALPWLPTATLLEPGAWLPCLALGVVAILSGGGWGWVVALGFGGAMPLLAGGYQPTVYAAYGLGVFAVAVLCERWQRGLAIRWTAIGKLALAGLLAVATAAPQLLTTLAWTAETARQTRSLTDLQMMMRLIEAARWERISVFFFRRSSADLCHLSIPVIALVAIGMIGRRAIAVAVGLGALATALVSIVHPGSVFFPLYKAIPGFGMFRFPARILVLTSFFAAVGTALGVETLTRLRVLATPARRRVVELAALGTVVALLVWPYQNRVMLPWTAPAEVTRPDARFFPGATGPAADGRAWVPGGRLNLRAGAFVRQGMRQRVHVLQDYEPLTSRRLAAFMHAVAGLPAPGADAAQLFDGSLLRDPPILHPELLDVVAVGSMMTARTVAPPAASGWREVGRQGDLGVYRNDRALPRAYLLAHVRFVGDEAAALATITAPDFQVHGEAVLVGAPATEAEHALTSSLAAPAVRLPIAVDEPERVAVEVAPTGPGLVVLADTFAPGWEATVDGVSRRLWQTNYLVRGVVVGPGDRRVEFTYRAPGFALGIGVAAVTWGAFASAVAITRRRRRPA